MSPKIDFRSIISVPEEGLPGGPDERPLHDRLAADARVERVLIAKSVLHARVAALAREMRERHPARREWHFVVVLQGAVFFAKDLGERLFELDGAAVRYSFLKASTYGAGIKDARETAREVAIALRPTDIRGRDVVLVDDLIDQGFTLSRLRQYLLEQEWVRSLSLCVLLEKRLVNPQEPVRRLREQLQPEHVGFRVPDRWVAGYGIDAGGDFRNLPFIITVNEGYYRP